MVYVNGDSHAAAAECVNPYAWAEDDGLYWGLGQQPHPDNLRASFGNELANQLNAILVCEAQAGCSNDRVIRTTREWLKYNTADLVVIQWSTWEREEWFHNNAWWQVNASGIDHVPQELQEKYRHYIICIDWQEKTNLAHETIWKFHQELLEQNVDHVFFNGNNDFSKIQVKQDWGVNYINPYDPDATFDAVLRHAGFKTVNPNSWHFGPAAHCFWSKYLLQYIIANKFI
jgi:hypothetical protein